MSNVLVFAELRGTEPKKITFEMLSAAKKIAAASGGKVVAAAIGKGLAGLGAKLGPYGAAKVYIADGVEKYNTEGYANILANLIKAEAPGVVLIGATATGKDLAPRVAVKTGGGLASDIIGYRMDGANFVAKRPVFAGKAFVEVSFVAAPAFATVRPNTMPVDEPGAGAAEEAALAADLGAPKAQVVEVIAGKSGKLDLTEADRIVSGGRGMKDRANFKILEDLADVIGATVGASRAAVDAGYADQAQQVGQTGKVVNPTLYVACGISGAIQHLAGMRTSKVIVAINKDPEAPIFQVADYGLVADLFDAVPIFTTEVKKLLAS
jgi:electron transfer flavoprotein alpha subunit